MCLLSHNPLTFVFVIVQCPPGYFNTEEGQITCTVCPSGYMCPLPDQLPIVCNPGEFSFSGSLICTSCPQGFSCSSPEDAPVSCRIGEYSNMTHCVSCLPGFYCPDPSLPPYPCPTGLYSSTRGLISCQICPVGHHCVDPAQSPVPCSSGTFSLSGSSLCQVDSLLQIVLPTLYNHSWLFCTIALP